MKVIFLDIDGVLNSRRTAIAAGGFPYGFLPDQMARFDPVAIALIRLLCRQTAAQVVISSTWRIGSTIEEFAPLALPVIGLTPELHTIRGAEIQAWLDAHPEVTRYVIVDDNTDMLPEHGAWFVRTTIDDGLRFQHYEKALSLLGAAP